MSRFDKAQRFSDEVVDGYHLNAAAALLRALPVPLIGKETFEGDQEECAKPSFLLGCCRQVILRQETGEELLRQILCVMRSAPLPPRERVKRRPINLA